MESLTRKETKILLDALHEVRASFRGALSPSELQNNEEYQELLALQDKLIAHLHRLPC